MAAAERTPAERLVTVLEHQASLYQRLHDLAARQHGLVEADDPTALLGVLADRERVVNEMQQCDAELQPFRKDWAGVSRQLTDPQRQRVQGLLDGNRELLASVLESDRRDMEQLSGRQQQVRTQLEHNASGARANLAYRNGSSVRETMTDSCG